MLGCSKYIQSTWKGIFIVVSEQNKNYLNWIDRMTSNSMLIGPEISNGAQPQKKTGHWIMDMLLLFVISMYMTIKWNQRKCSPTNWFIMWFKDIIITSLEWAAHQNVDKNLIILGKQLNVNFSYTVRSVNDHNYVWTFSINRKFHFEFWNKREFKQSPADNK